WASLHQSLDLFAPRLRFVDPQPESVGGRQAVRYTLQLAAEAEPGPLPEVSPGNLPVPPPARWRELAKPLGVSGALWLDAATGAALKLKVEGRFEINDREVRPTQLQLRHEATVANVGKVAAIKAPASIAELKRAAPEVDPISFF